MAMIRFTPSMATLSGGGVLAATTAMADFFSDRLPPNMDTG
jgi:hypothetical protein